MTPLEILHACWELLCELLVMCLFICCAAVAIVAWVAYGPAVGLATGVFVFWLCWPVFRPEDPQ